MAVEIRPFGQGAVRATLPSGFAPRPLLVALRAQPGVFDAVVTERYALVTFDPAAPPPKLADCIDRVLEAHAAEPAVSAAREHLVEVRYDGEDLNEVATASGLPPEEVVRLHADGRYMVAAIGFLPGFAYLRGLHPSLVVARRTRPRARVPAHCVAVAGPYTGIYPFDSPGGWNLVGHALRFRAFEPRSGATFALGDRVQFVRVAS